MLREIGSGRQDGSRGLRRWFQDEYFDLYVWHAASGAPVGMQLCYDRSRREGAITWDERSGFGHDQVDDGEGGPFLNMTPILRADGAPPYFRIYDRFHAASAECPREIRDFVIERLRDFRVALYGTPRKPRRRRIAKRVDTPRARE